MNTNTTRNAVQINALLGLDDPAAFAPDEVTVRKPDFVDSAVALDFIDSTVSTAVWIGPDAAVEIPTDLLAELPVLVHRSGWLARNGQVPSEFGISVVTFDAHYAHPAGGSSAYQAWRAVTDTLAG
jgi:hypothetical protein